MAVLTLIMELGRCWRARVLNSEILLPLPTFWVLGLTHVPLFKNWAFSPTLLLSSEEKYSPTPKWKFLHSILYKHCRKSTSVMQVGIAVPKFLCQFLPSWISIKNKQTKDTSFHYTGSLISRDWETVVFYNWKKTYYNNLEKCDNH